jgi:hypothetical protein
MSEPLEVLEPTVFRSVMESAGAPAIDPVLQFRVVSYVAMAVAAPFIIGHLLIGVLGFPYLAQLFAQEALPAPTALMLGMGWLAGPIIAIVDIATFWLIYRLAKRWWIGLLFVPAFIYLMMMAFIGFLFYLPLFPLVKLA